MVFIYFTDAVEGFNVFKGSKSVPEITDQDKVENEDDPLKGSSMQIDIEVGIDH